MLNLPEVVAKHLTGRRVGKKHPLVQVGVINGIFEGQLRLANASHSIQSDCLWRIVDFVAQPVVKGSQFVLTTYKVSSRSKGDEEVVIALGFPWDFCNVVNQSPELHKDQSEPLVIGVLELDKIDVIAIQADCFLIPNEKLRRCFLDNLYQCHIRN
jgi:hypothetical protein